ncbi:hypothetical protein OIU77_016352 [Salix suchowensis]|uniref:SWIM-type domain-containing protein n=1 Tax=Salix suchowensis TaxID=1278906 RepID=A0ABQ8ZK59_9ROSI|nr:hypothetical protein OIU77_016352 [Salix suchowensis]
MADWGPVLIGGGAVCAATTWSFVSVTRKQQACGFWELEDERNGCSCSYSHLFHCLCHSHLGCSCSHLYRLITRVLGMFVDGWKFSKCLSMFFLPFFSPAKEEIVFSS